MAIFAKYKSYSAYNLRIIGLPIPIRYPNRSDFSSLRECSELGSTHAIVDRSKKGCSIFQTKYKAIHRDQAPEDICNLRENISPRNLLERYGGHHVKCGVLSNRRCHILRIEL